MKCFFDSCNRAVEYATDTRSFGIYYSEMQEPNSEIHIHECCELLLCLKGGKSFLIDNNMYEAKNGDLFMINQFEAHKITADPQTNFARYIMHIHPTFLYSNSSEDANLGDCFYNTHGKSHNKLHLSDVEQKELTALFEELRGEGDYADGMFKRITALRILLTVNKMCATHSDSAATNSRHRTVQLAIDYINNNYSGELTLDTVSKNSYVSANQLCKLFKLYCNTTVTKYILSKRISEAKKLLADGRSVTDTAFMCGFNDYASFIRVFKKTVGTPPGKYRASVCKNELV